MEEERMNINRTTYKLPKANYIPEKGSKSKIILMNTYNSGMKHYDGWLTRMGGEYKHTTAFTIDRDGSIYQHFSPDYSGKIFDKPIDETIIAISMVNLGYLRLDIGVDGFVTWLGDIYKGDRVVEKRWRGHKFWEPYTDEQVESAIDLAKYLCKRYGIVNNAVPHNTKMMGVKTFNGILCRSNFEKYYSDLSPAWDFEHVKERLEHEKESS